MYASRIRGGADAPRPSRSDAEVVNRSEEAMWHDGIVDWIILGSGYVLAVGLFAWLGGVARAGEAIRNWGRESTTNRTAGHRL
jgi:hypothetical protein